MTGREKIVKARYIVEGITLTVSKQREIFRSYYLGVVGLTFDLTFEDALGTEGLNWWPFLEPVAQPVLETSSAIRVVTKCQVCSFRWWQHCHTSTQSLSTSSVYFIKCCFNQVFVILYFYREFHV